MTDRQKAEETYQKMGEWLNSKGYDLDLDEDGFWFEDYISEHKWKDIFDLMLDFHAQQVEGVTDEEIEKQYPINSHHQMDTDSWNNKLKQEGAKWLRSRIKGGKE